LEHYVRQLSSVLFMKMPSPPPAPKKTDKIWHINHIFENLILQFHIRYICTCSKQKTSNIYVQVLGYQNIPAIWGPKSLNNEQKATCMGICLEHLLWYTRGGQVLGLYCQRERILVFALWSRD
jgi:hypothetical protein